MKKKTKKTLIKGILGLIIIAGVFYQTQIAKQLPLDSSSVEFLACTDGDTAHFSVNGQDETVRFIAIDTPETKHPQKGVEPFGQEASDFTCNSLKSAAEIKLEYEPSNETDKYGRLIAWIFIDGQLLQEQLIQEGYAKVAYLYGDYKYTSQLEDAEAIAKQNQIGIWSLE